MVFNTRTLFAAAVAMMAASSASAAPSRRHHLPQQQAPCEPEFPSGICTVKGVDGPMVVNATYKIDSMWKCEGKVDKMSIWCTSEGPNVKPYYCCGSACDDFQLPKKRMCKVNGKKYTVGKAYKVKFEDGAKGKMWCINETEYRTCTNAGKNKCGSTLELTPPEPKKHCEPVKPQPPVVRPENCYDCATCTYYGFKWNAGRCLDSCRIMDAPCLSTPAQCEAPKPPKPSPDQCRDCYACTKNGYAFDVNTGRCQGRCNYGGTCVYRPEQCPVEPAPGDFKTCESCTKASYAWTNNKCQGRCDYNDANCATKPSECVPAPPQPEDFTDCNSCIGAGFTYQPEAQKCTRSCDIQDISCIQPGMQCPLLL